MRTVDGNTPLSLLGRIVNVLVTLHLGHLLLGQKLCDGGRQSGLTVVHMAYGAHITMWLVSLVDLGRTNTGWLWRSSHVSGLKVDICGGRQLSQNTIAGRSVDERLHLVTRYLSSEAAIE